MVVRDLARERKVERMHVSVIRKESGNRAILRTKQATLRALTDAKPFLKQLDPLISPTESEYQSFASFFSSHLTRPIDSAMQQRSAIWLGVMSSSAGGILSCWLFCDS